eukprot:scaffold7641_cov115-Cylindrotheca_fusiformis.AAC.4
MLLCVRVFRTAKGRAQTLGGSNQGEESQHWAAGIYIKRQICLSRVEMLPRTPVSRIAPLAQDWSSVPKFVCSERIDKKGPEKQCLRTNFPILDRSNSYSVGLVGNWSSCQPRQCLALRLVNDFQHGE